ncbi:MAG TPA: alpha/beta hydrolase [Allosphingosinicella sp.]|jgi:pimeloyl-ACP methyl ester carboxylesterase
MQIEKTIELGRERSLHILQAGKGPDVVLIHGALTTHSDWLEGQFQTLARRFRVTAVDRPGHGLSRRPRFEGTPRDQAAQIRDGLHVLGIEQAVFVGHSMGGLVALAMAEQFPELVERLVLVAPIAFPEARPLEHSLFAPRAVPFFGPLLSQFGAATVDRPMLKAVQRLMFAPQPVPERWEANYPYARILTSEGMVAEGEETAAILPFAPAGIIDLAKVAAPTHILTGVADRVCNPDRHARPLALMLRDSRLTERPGVGHMLHHAEPEAFIAAVEDALETA